MSRYIDADKLCKGLKDMAKYQEPYKQSTILGVVSTIENTPIANVVEVVRCKDCVYRHSPDCALWYGSIGDIDYLVERGDNFYCNYGRSDNDYT